ncbi:MAG TPA: DUF116 domain-containing protein [Chitinispirillaceae bacterium]|nr:DUF116 domain-containing protein [Chitinispirillaceae bacterium]
MAPIETISSTAQTQTPLTFREESMWRQAWTKATFLVFCWLGFFLFTLVIGLIYYLIHPRLLSISPILDTIALIGLIGATFIPGVGLFLISATALTGIDLLYPHNGKSITVTLLFPFAVMLAQLFRINRNKIRVSFVKVNNAMTIAQAKRIKGDRLLILLPHCLQIDKCNRKITNDVNNCARCGKCPVSGLLELGEKYGLFVEVVNGGTLARKRVATFKPDGIIAVACERDLTFGILDVYPTPVYGVINDRPNGPCFNTNVDLSMVESAVRFFRKDVVQN